MKDFNLLNLFFYSNYYFNFMCWKEFFSFILVVLIFKDFLLYV